MKTINKLFGALACLSLILGLGACTEEYEYTPGEMPSGSQVYFSTTTVATTQVDLSSTESSFTVEVCRAETSSAATVNLNVTDESGLFTIPSSVSFNAGEATAQLTIGYNPAKLVFGTYYPITLTVEESVSTPYAPATYAFNAGIPMTWTAVATGDYAYSLFFSGADPGLTLYQCDQDPSLFRIPNWGYGVDFTFTYDAAANTVVVDDFFIGYTDATNGDVYVMDVDTYAGQTVAGPGYFEDNVFYFNVIYYVSAGYYGMGTETFTLTEGSIN